MRSPSSDLWRNDAFVRFWTGRTISIFGSLVTRLALPFVAILALQAGPLEVAVLRSVDLAAALVVGLFAGAWVDRLRRRPILIWTDLFSAAALASVPLAYLLGVLGLAQLLVVAAAAAVLATFGDAADNAYLPSVVERPQLVRANGALEASCSAAEFAGFGIGGFLVQALTAPIAIAVDAVSFLFSAALLISIRRPEADPPRKEPADSPGTGWAAAGRRAVPGWPAAHR